MKIIVGHHAQNCIVIITIAHNMAHVHQTAVYVIVDGTVRTVLLRVAQNISG